MKRFADLADQLGQVAVCLVVELLSTQLSLDGLLRGSEAGRSRSFTAR